MEYLLVFITALAVVSITLTMMLDLDPNFQVTGNPRITHYDEEGITVNIADVQVAPSTAVIEEIELVVNGKARTLASPDNVIHFSDLGHYVYLTDVGTSLRDNIGVLIITSDEGTATVKPIIAN